MPLTFRTARWLRTINLVLQAVLILTFVGGLNYLALHHGWRFDLTENRRHSLSPETLSYLSQLKAPVHIVVTLTDDTDNDEVTQAFRDVTNLLREYVHATAANSDNRITTEFFDVYQNRRAAEAHGITQPNSILVTSGTKSRAIDLKDLYAVENRTTKTGFTGEQAFTAAVLDVSSPGVQRIYFTTGHGEMEPDDIDPARGISLLSGELRARNFQIAILDIAKARTIPSDAALVVIAGPQVRFDPFEVEQLRQYLTNNAGRVLALLPPPFRHNLDPLLLDWGIIADDAVVFDPGPTGQNESGDLIIAPALSEHPVVAFLSKNQIPLRFGLTRPLRPYTGRAPDPNFNVTALAAASESAWGESNYRDTGVPSFDPALDTSPQVVVATASERLPARTNLDFSIRGGRIVAIGGADWLANGRLAAGGNLNLALSSINWLVDRDTQLAIAPRPIQTFQLSLSQDQLTRLRYSLMLILPGVAAVLGTFVYWTRRS